jgi:integrase
MAKRRARRPSNRIVGLVTRRLADATTAYYWMPSPTLRKEGWHSQPLGRDRQAAIAAAEAINQRVTFARAAPAVAVAPRAPKRRHLYNFADLVDAYYKSDEFAELRPKSQREYKSRLGWLSLWADDGELPIASITVELCHRLRDTLVANDSPWNAAAKLRVLRIVMGWAAHKRRRIIPDNPASALNIPTPPKRKKRVAVEALDALVTAGTKAIGTSMGLAILLGFYTTQREADLLAATTFNWKDIRDIAAIDRAVLAGPDGRVMGLEGTQQKTGAPYSAPVPPSLSAMVAAELAARTHERGEDYTGPLLVEDRNELRPRHWPDWQFQRDYRVTIEAAIEAAEQESNDWLVAQLTGLKFRDLRRSGMCWLRENGATVSMIAALSGHSIRQTTDILDTYLPADPRAAAAGVAHALRTSDVGGQQKVG